MQGSERENVCFICGYDLAGLEGACPECGRPVFRFTDRAREVIADANRLAIDLLARRVPAQRTQWWRCLLPQTPLVIRPRHIVAAIARGPAGVGYHALLACRVDPEELAASIERRGTWGYRMQFAEEAVLPLGPAARAMVRVAVDEAFKIEQDWVGTEHLLLAATKSIDRVARGELAKRGVTAESVIAFVRKNAASPAEAPGGPPG